MRAEMAEFRCRSCGKDGTWVYDPDRFTCPVCESIDVQFVVFRHELSDEDPVARKMDALAEAEGKNTPLNGSLADEDR